MITTCKHGVWLINAPNGAHSALYCKTVYNTYINIIEVVQ